ncbi:MAG: glycosyltransferase [Lachnospiraceae bacterium]|nr:glycosyltransferase [Lachnospiraceae bacterium]
MKVLLYSGGKNLVAESGVGKALQHQEQALAVSGITFTENARDDYDIVHLNTVLPDARRMAVKAGKAGKRVVYHGHSTMEDFKNSFVGSNLAAPLFRKWICSCYEQADLILTPTEYSRSLLMGYGLKKPVVSISNGIDTEYFRKEPGQRERFRQKYGFTEEEKVVLCVGLPIERKGLLDVVRLAKEFPEYSFVWCGHMSPGLLPANIKKAMADASENLHFAGYLNREALRDAYGGADLFFFPSQEETEGIVMLEALSMEIPILVRDIPVYDDWLQDGKEAWKAKNLHSFTQRLWEILEGHLPSLTSAGRKVAEERDLKIIGTKLATLYQMLL